MTNKSTLGMAGAIFFLLLIFTPGRLITVDTGLRLEVSRALWKSGTVFVPRTEANGQVFAPSKQDPNLGTSFYGIGQSLLLIPFDMLGYALGRAAGFPAGSAGAVETLTLVFIYAPLLGTLLWVVMGQLLIALNFAPSVARLSATLLLFGTTCLVYCTQILQEEIPIAVLLCWGLTLWLRYLATEDRRFAFWGTLAIASTFLFRMNTVFALIPLAGLLLDRAFGSGKKAATFWRAAPATGLAIALITATFVLFSYWRYGVPFSNGYSELPVETVTLVGLRPVLAWGVLFGLGKGFLILSPLAFLALFGLFSERRRYRFLLAGLIFTLVASSLVYSRLSGTAFPDGSESWGARFQTHLWFFFAVGLALFIEKRPLSTGPKLLIALSLFFQLASCWAPDALEAYAYPGETQTDKKTRLLMSGTDGQLFRRLKTMAFFYRSDFPDEWRADDNRLKMVSHYVPNFWGPAVWKKLQGSTLGVLILLAWVSNVIVAGFLAWRVLRR